MFVDSSTTRLNGKAYPRHLLRESYREAGKVKHRTIANLSHCKAEEVEAIRLALRHKADLAGMVAAAAERALELVQGPSVGAVWLLSQLARDLGIVAALGSDRQGKLALWQVIARVLDQGSRLSAVRLAGGHAAGVALGMISFDEDDLYANLDWLAQHQADIETRLFAQRKPASAPDVFLYDVTSTYLEGEQNAFAAFGYNRDRKSGKRQIVIGLLCDADGRPLSIELFAGNTSDVKTFSSQLSKAATRFGAERVTFVGDRGMIKAPQRAELGAADFHYITAITKAQIDGLIAAGVLQMDLFEQTLAEVEGKDGERYVLRRNPTRAEELAASRQDKLTTLRTGRRDGEQISARAPEGGGENAALQAESPGEDAAHRQVRSGRRGATLRGPHSGSGGVDRIGPPRWLLRPAHRSAQSRRIEGRRARPLQGPGPSRMGVPRQQVRAPGNAAGLSARRESHTRPCPRRHAGLSDGAGTPAALARQRPDG